MLVAANQGAVLRVGILRTSSIGDVVLASACLTLLDQLQLPVEAVWLGRNPALQLLRDAYPNLPFIEVAKDPSIPDLVEQLQGTSFLVDLQGNWRSRLLARAFKKAYGKPTYHAPKAQFQRNRMILEGRMLGRRRPLSERALAPEQTQFQTMVQTLRTALLRHAPANAHPQIESLHQAVPRLPLPPLPPNTVWERDLQQGIWLAVAPGASFATKRAPESLFIESLALAQQKYYDAAGSGAATLGLVFLGDATDRVCAQAISDALAWRDPILNLCGTLSLTETARALHRCRILLSNDSSLGHIAEACDTPVAVLFGPTVEGFGFAPHLPQSRAFSVPIGCRPCSKHGKAPCRFGDRLCFAQISRPIVAEFLAHTLLTRPI